jgi:large subunit ribosomal protein L13
MKTQMPKATDGETRQWVLVDAEGQVLGRLATALAHRLRGKHRPDFAPHLDQGDFVIVINAEKIRLTGRKWDQKMYYRHSGYVGGLKSIVAKKLLVKDPEELIRHAVRGMLPKNHLGRSMLKKLKVYAGTEHPHQAQRPQPLSL